MKRGNIPARDGEFNSFQLNLLSYASGKKVEFEIPDAVITQLTASQALWVAIWALVSVKSTRTSQQVTEKKQIRATYEAQIRDFIQQYIMVNPAVSDGDREAMLIKPRATHHTIIPAPSTLPDVSILQEAGHRVKFFFRQQPDAEGVSRRAKPDGVDRCEIVYSVNEVPADPSECNFNADSTRSPEVFQFSQAQAGQKAYFYARWVNHKGEGGPFTDMQQCIIP